MCTLSSSKIISPVSDTGGKASLITGVMNLGRTVVRWWDLTLESGMMTIAMLRINISASISTVSPVKYLAIKLLLFYFFLLSI